MKDNLPDRADGPLIMVIGDRSEPLMLALLDLEASRPGICLLYTSDAADE